MGIKVIGLRVYKDGRVELMNDETVDLSQIDMSKGIAGIKVYKDGRQEVLDFEDLDLEDISIGDIILSFLKRKLKDLEMIEKIEKEIGSLDINSFNLDEEDVIRMISKKSGRQITECQCEDCKSHCEGPCLGTPKDILKLIKAGYIDRLAKTVWMIGHIEGECPPIPMVQAKKTKNGCTFKTSEGLCELHQLGLKPTEGKLSHHTFAMDNFEFEKSIAWNVAREWINTKNIPIIMKILRELK